MSEMESMREKVRKSLQVFQHLFGIQLKQRKQLKQRGGNNQINNKRTISGRTDLRIKARPKFAGWNQQQSKD